MGRRREQKGWSGGSGGSLVAPVGGRWCRRPENTLKCGCLVGKGFWFLSPSHSLPVDYPPFRSFTVVTRIFGTLLASVDTACSQRLRLWASIVG